MGQEAARAIRQRHSLKPGEDFADRILVGREFGKAVGSKSRPSRSATRSASRADCRGCEAVIIPHIRYSRTPLRLSCSAL